MFYSVGTSWEQKNDISSEKKEQILFVNGYGYFREWRMFSDSATVEYAQFVS